MNNQTRGLALIILGALGIVAAFIMQNQMNSSYRNDGSAAAWVVGCGAFLTILTGVIVASLPDRWAGSPQGGHETTT